jgi:hypothetical protein
MSPPDHQVEVFVPIWMQLRGGYRTSDWQD